MAKIIAGELSGGAVATAISLLENEATDAETLKATINSFITGTTDKLTGPAYDAVRAKAESYITILTTRARIARELSSAITSAVSEMSAYVDGYNELDDSKLADITSELNSINSTISQIKYNYNNTQSSDETPKSTAGYSSLIAPYVAQYNELTKLKEKLAGLAAADASAYGKLNSLTMEVTSYSTTISTTKPSSVVI